MIAGYVDCHDAMGVGLQSRFMHAGYVDCHDAMGVGLQSRFMHAGYVDCHDAIKMDQSELVTKGETLREVAQLLRGWNREAGEKEKAPRAGTGAARYWRELQRRSGTAHVCSVCMVDSSTDEDSDLS